MKKLSILALAPFLIGANVNAPTLLHFSVGGVRLELPTPKGFCLPTGKLLDEAKARASLSNDISVTHLTLYGCSESGELDSNRYLVIQTMNKLVALTVTRPQLLAAVGSAFDRPDFSALLKARTEADNETVMKNNPISFSTIGPLGRDEMCAYLGGMGQVNYGGQIDTMAEGSCLTATSGKGFAVFIYHRTKDEKEVLSLVKMSRNIAEKVQPDRS